MKLLLLLFIFTAFAFADPIDPMKIYIKQNNSETKITFKVKKSKKVLLTYESVTTGQKSEKLISNKNYKYLTKGITLPKGEFQIADCQKNFYIINKNAECLEADTASSKIMKSAILKIYNSL